MVIYGKSGRVEDKGGAERDCDSYFIVIQRAMQASTTHSEEPFSGMTKKAISSPPPSEECFDCSLEVRGMLTSLPSDDNDLEH
jgi:hypothetical protein